MVMSHRPCLRFGMSFGSSASAGKASAVNRNRISVRMMFSLGWACWLFRRSTGTITLRPSRVLDNTAVVQLDQAPGKIHDEFVMGGENEGYAVLLVHVDQQLHEVLGGLGV